MLPLSSLGGEPPTPQLLAPLRGGSGEKAV